MRLPCHVGALESRPEALDAVGVRHAPDILGDGMLDGFVRVGQPLIGRCLVAVDRRVRVSVLHDEALQRRLGRICHHAGRYLVRCPVLHPHDCSLADCATAYASIREFFPLRVAHVGALPAEVGLVNLDRSLERRSVTTTTGLRHPGFPDAVQHEPRRRLTYLDLVLELHGRDRLETGHAEVDGKRPFPERDFRVRERRTRLDGEVGPAVRAPVRHLPMAGLNGARATAVPAASAIRPVDTLEPRGRRRLIREHIH